MNPFGIDWRRELYASPLHHLPLFLSLTSFICHRFQWLARLRLVASIFQQENRWVFPVSSLLPSYASMHQPANPVADYMVGVVGVEIDGLRGGQASPPHHLPLSISCTSIRLPANWMGGYMDFSGVGQSRGGQVSPPHPLSLFLSLTLIHLPAN